MSRGETQAAYLFLSPWLIGFAVFTAGSMVASLVLSMTDYDVISPATWVGFANYAEIVSDPVAKRALLNTFYYTALHVPLATVVALGLAMLLNRISRLRGFFRTVFYLPAMTPAVAVGVLFLLLLNGQTGVVNDFLGLFGIPGPGWTTESGWIMPGIILMSLWSVGGTMVIFLAALQNVPRDLYEAGAIDGVGRWSRFSSDAATLYLIYLFQSAFTFLRMGYASALAWVLFVIIVVITLVQVRFADRFVYYESEPR
ncbi:carbohydrate ABC transporter permease [Flindersiella endophytica]